MGTLIKFIEDELKKFHLTDNKGVRVEKRSSGCKLNLNFSREEPENGKAYDGPFAVIDITEDETPELRVASGKIFLGTEVVDFPETDLILTATGVLYLHITYDSEYSVLLLDDTELPEQDNDNLYIEIAGFTLNGEGTAVTIDWSWTGGNVHAAGRIFSG